MSFGHVLLPIVVESSFDYLERHYHSPTPERYYYVLHWATANGPASGRFGIQQYKHMEAWAPRVSDGVRRRAHHRRGSIPGHP